MKLYNLQLVEKMCRGNQEQIAKMAEVFVEQIIDAINEIEAAYTEKDFIKIVRLSHKIKPTLTYFGTDELAEEFLLTEDLLSNEITAPEVDMKISALKLIAQEVVDQMKNDFNITNT
jgi:HPt (histidine-containing phosphotransfer) domain-containing protein